MRRGCYPVQRKELPRALDHPDAHRLVIEIASVYVQCDDCGHSRTLYLRDLRQASSLGVHNYRQLCQKVRCSECPKAPPAYRNLSIRPTWLAEVPAQSVS